MQLDACGPRTVRPWRRPLCKRAATRPRGVLYRKTLPYICDLSVWNGHALHVFQYMGLMFTGRTLEQDDCTERHKIPMQCLSGLGVRRIPLTKGK